MKIQSVPEKKEKAAKGTNERTNERTTDSEEEDNSGGERHEMREADRPTAKGWPTRLLWIT